MQLIKYLYAFFSSQNSFRFSILYLRISIKHCTYKNIDIIIVFQIIKIGTNIDKTNTKYRNTINRWFSISKGKYSAIAKISIFSPGLEIGNYNFNENQPFYHMFVKLKYRVHFLLLTYII